MAHYSYTEQDMNVAKFFASKRAQDAAHYAKRGNNPKKVYADVANGALAEIAVHRALSATFPQAFVPQPDLAYKSVRKKSWEPDFMIRFGKEEQNVSVKCHVKSFLTGRFGGNIKDSFMFQKGHGNHADRDISLICKGGNVLDLFVPVVNRVQDFESGVLDSVETNAIADCCTVYGPYSMQDIVDKNLWKKPKKKSLHAYKRVLYLDDIWKNIPVVNNINV